MKKNKSRVIFVADDWTGPQRKLEHTTNCLSFHKPEKLKVVLVLIQKPTEVRLVLPEESPWSWSTINSNLFFTNLKIKVNLLLVLIQKQTRLSWSFQKIAIHSKSSHAKFITEPSKQIPPKEKKISLCGQDSLQNDLAHACKCNGNCRRSSVWSLPTPTQGDKTNDGIS